MPRLKLLPLEEEKIGKSKKGVSKKIIVISLDPWLDRLHGSSVLSLFEALSKHGFDITVLLPSSKNTIRTDFYTVRTFNINKRPLFRLIDYYILGMRYILNEEPFSTLVADCNSLPFFIFFRLRKRTKGIMLILSRPVGEKGFLGAIQALSFRISVHLSKYIVNEITAISYPEAIEFSKICHFPRERIAVIPSPVSRLIIDYRLRNIKELRRRIFGDDLARKIIVLYHGFLDENRGVLDVVRTFSMAFKDRSDIALLLVGDGPTKKRIESEVEMNILKNIVVWEKVAYAQIPDFVAACDIGLVILIRHPWWQNQCPTKLVEFLALGKPIIASDLPGIKWVVKDIDNVIIIDELTVQTLIAAVNQALQKTRNIDGIKRAQTFSADMIALKLKKIID